MTTVIDSSQISYDQVISNHGTYIIERVGPKSNSQETITLTSSSNPECIIEIPNKLYNYGWGAFETSMTIATAGSARYAHFKADALSLIRTLEFYTTSGVYPVRIENLEHYLDVTTLYEISLAETISNDNFAKDGGVYEGTRTSNSLATNNIRSGGDVSKDNYLEPLYYLASSANTPMTIKVKFKLANLIGTILCLDKDQYFGEITYLRLVFNNTTKGIVLNSDSATDPSSDIEAYTGNITLSNIRLLLPRETNQLVISNIMSKVSTTGLSYDIPFIHGMKFNMSGTYQSVNFIISPFMGSRLLRIYISHYNNDESLNTVYDRDNTAGAKVTSFFTTLDNEKLQQYDLVCANYDDYYYMRQYIEKSCIINSDMYQYFNVWIENFCDGNDNAETRLKKMRSGTIVDGKPILKDWKYEKNLTCATTDALNHYVFILTLRRITINSNGVFLI